MMPDVYCKYKYQQDISYNIYFLIIKYSLNGEKYYKIKVDLTEYLTDSTGIKECCNRKYWNYHTYESFISSILKWDDYVEQVGEQIFIKHIMRTDMKQRNIQDIKIQKSLKALQLLKTKFRNRWTISQISLDELNNTKLVHQDTEKIQKLFLKYEGNSNE